MHLERVLMFLLIAAALGFVPGCEDDENGPAGQATTFRLTIENIAAATEFLRSGVFDTPVGADDPGPAGTGDVYEFTFTAPEGSRLSFATMFVPSNDFFFAPGEEGIALYDAQGDPVEGDVTDQVMLWDAGTEVNQEPGLGPDQAPTQPAPDTGDPDPNVRLAPDDFANLPAVDAVIQVTIEAGDDGEFTVRIENVSDDMTLATSDAMTQAVPIAPGVFVVHEAAGALFESGAPAGAGLEVLAEDGDPDPLATALAPMFDESGTIPPTGGVPIGPGESYQVTFEAAAGDQLSFATMFVQSNDLFYAPGETGIALFTAADDPVAGDVTAQVLLWDAGTEVNQEPGVGPDQAPRQAAPDTGADEDANVRPIAQVNDGFEYPATASVIRVTLQTVEQAQLLGP